MKVILTEYVEKLGESHEVVEVAEGYARNFLMPRSLAVPASKSAMANLDNMRQITDRRQARLKVGATEVSNKLDGMTVVMPAKVGSGGRLYGSIGAADIALQLKKDFGVDIDKKQVSLPEPIRNAGLHSVMLDLHREVRPRMIVQVGDAPVAGIEAAPQTQTAEPAAA